jgi:superfamily II DNA or RNA helicase
MAHYGRDRRRLATIEERRALYLRAEGRCQRTGCGELLGDDWHASHLTAWTNGGATSLDDMEAWCVPCNLDQGSTDVAIPGLTLRPWQEEALTVVLERIFRSGYATLHAAPGAGKTILAGSTYMRLADAGLVERMVVVVPNTALRTQWADSLAGLSVHLDPSPADGWLEHRNTVGSIVTYHSLPNTALNHRDSIERVPTLVVLDEVHHIGDKAAWGRAVAKMLGDVQKGELAAAGVLNMTGTLFRSSGSKRISTVRYRPSEEDPTKIEAVEDFSIRTSDLVPTYLRRPNVFTYGTDVELLDTSTGEIVAGDIADLDVQQRAAVLRESWSKRDWIEGFARQALRALSLQQAVVGPGEPLKLLYVAANQRAAKRAADALNELTDSDFARLVISDEPDAVKTLERAARANTSLAIVSVQMVTEGFDCPAISTIAYASNRLADLTIAQTMARAMRITETERNMGKILPATIIIPNDVRLKEAFQRALVGHMHLIAEEESTVDVVVTGDGSQDPLLPRYQLIDLTGPILHGATVVGMPDGDIDAAELDVARAPLIAAGLPETYHPNAIVGMRSVPRFPRIYSEPEPAPPSKGATRREPHPREIVEHHCARLATLGKWMAGHIGHDSRWEEARYFNADANREANIPKGGRHAATVEQLQRCEAWMTGRIREHVNAHEDCRLPAILEGD